MQEILINVAVGVWAGVLAAGTGYLRRTPLPEFEPKTFLRTVVIGAIVGGAAGYNPAWTEDVVLNTLQAYGLVTVIDRLVTLAVARIKGLLKKIFPED